jgi:hypothetical protein
MRNRYAFFGLVLFYCTGCGSSDNADETETLNYSIEIVDSLQIGYLGDLWIIDYDSVSEEFISLTKRDQEILIFDQYGEIKNSFEIPLEGPGSINGIFLISMRDREIQIFDSSNGFFELSERGEILKTTPIPYRYIYLNQSIADAFFPFGNEIAYLRPEYFDSLGYYGGMGGMVKGMYYKSFMEALDTLTKQTRPLMPFPKESLYADGNCYFLPFPRVQRFGGQWYLSFLYELKFFVYQEKDQELILEMAVDLEVGDAVKPLGVPFDEIQNYFELSKNIKPAGILGLYHTGKNIIVIYQKGTSEDVIVRNQQEANPIDLNLIEETYAAIFNSKNELIQNDILVPSGLIFSRVITKDGEILVKKNQDYFGSEEDQVVYYKLKWKNEIG